MGLIFSRKKIIFGINSCVNVEYTIQHNTRAMPESPLFYLIFVPNHHDIKDIQSDMLRTYHLSDLEQIVALFTGTVQTISSVYYSPEELEAWAPSCPDMNYWRSFFTDRNALVTESNGKITGFGCLGMNGDTVDMLFTHHEHQSKGNGSIILDALEKEAARRGQNEIFLTDRKSTRLNSSH